MKKSRFTEQQVAYGAPDQVGLISLAAQPRHDLEGAVADVLAGYAVLFPGDDLQAFRCPCRFWNGAQSITEEAAACLRWLFREGK